jgi:hypothetical protein
VGRRGACARRLAAGRREIEKVIEVPVAALLDRGCFRVELWERDGVEREVYFYEYRDTTIWGATARILKQYLDLVEAAA